MDWYQVRSLMHVAIRSGGRRTGLTSVEWDVSGNCQSPVTRWIHARPFAGDPSGRKATGLEVNLTARCRKCDPCRAKRRILWSARARQETRAAFRTWFGTLTLRPEEQYRALVKARSFADKRIENFDGLPYWQQFQLRHQAICPELTKYLKRVREESGAPLRYLLVAEAHKSGAPHYHMLVHETDIDKQVRHRTLSEQWRLGFTQWKLITEPRQAVYLCKYLSKSNAARVRASLRYGTNEREVTGMHDLSS